jgi:hypothetical protein
MGKYRASDTSGQGYSFEPYTLHGGFTIKPISEHTMTFTWAPPTQEA